MAAGGGRGRARNEGDLIGEADEVECREAGVLGHSMVKQERKRRGGSGAVLFLLLLCSWPYSLSGPTW
jgi:hypothetical protein